MVTIFIETETFISSRSGEAMLLRKIEIALCSRCIETSTSVGATFKNFVFCQISPCFFFFDTRTCLRDNELTLRLEIV